MIENVADYNEDGCLTFAKDNCIIKISNEDIKIIDKYGNIIFMNNVGLGYESHFPTYDELYEHWLKTKGE